MTIEQEIDEWVDSCWKQVVKNIEEVERSIEMEPRYNPGPKMENRECTPKEIKEAWMVSRWMLFGEVNKDCDYLKQIGIIKED